MILTALLACNGSTEPDVLPERTSLAPLDDDNRAPTVPVIDGNETPETIVTQSGFDFGRFRWRSHMRGYVAADLVDVWAALQVPDVMADRRFLDDYRVSDQDFRPDVDHSFVFDCELDRSGRAFEFDITWLHAVEEGTLDDPQLVIATWELTEGPDILPKIEGSLELEQIEPGLTELRGIYHQGAAAAGAGGMERYWEDLHADIIATLDGEDLEEYVD